tara:strand:- start:224 stop:640 length:417 start_codon:yes stop_codon:yes gene_type:complete
MVNHYIGSYMGLFDIYNKQIRRTIMAKETMKDMLKMIDAKINHIEDMVADNRAVIIKLVKQNNSIVRFLSELQLDVEDATQSYSEETFNKSSEIDISTSERITELLEDFMEKSEELQEFEEELKKHKDKLTPGQIGES